MIDGEGAWRSTTPTLPTFRWGFRSLMNAAGRWQGTSPVEFAHRSGAGVRQPRKPGKFAASHRLPVGRSAFVHAVAHLIGGLFEMHDRSRFEVHVYSTGPTMVVARGDAPRAAPMSFAMYRPSGVVIGQAIAMDGIDILVDLSGYTLYGRPEALACARPRPGRLPRFHGHPGAPWIDYTLLDRVTLLPEMRQWWDEKIVTCLPGFALRTASFIKETPSRQAAGLPEDAFVLSALHMPRKIDPSSSRFGCRCWRRYRAPCCGCWQKPHRSRPICVRQPMRPAGCRRALCSRRWFRGRRTWRVTRWRICSWIRCRTTGIRPSSTRSLPVFRIDDAGSTVVTRVSEAMLTLCGLQALVADDDSGFVDLAARFAGDRAWRASVLTTLQQGQSRLFDNAGRVREMECAYETMWARYRAGLPPEDFDVGPRFKKTSCARPRSCGRRRIF